MNSFKSNLELIFGKEYIMFFNIDYFYDFIGEDFNDLINSFNSWAFNSKDVIEYRLSLFCLSHTSELSKKLVSFNEKLSSLPKIHTDLIKEIHAHLMNTLAKKKHGVKFFYISYASYNSVIVCDENTWTNTSVNKEYLGETYDVWIHLRNIYIECMKLKKRFPRLTLDQFVSHDNRKIMLALIQYLFRDDIRVLNLDYLSEELDSILGEIINKIKKAIESKTKKHIVRINLFYVKSSFRRLGITYENFPAIMSEIVPEIKITSHSGGLLIVVERCKNHCEESV